MGQTEGNISISRLLASWQLAWPSFGLNFSVGCFLLSHIGVHSEKAQRWCAQRAMGLERKDARKLSQREVRKEGEGKDGKMRRKKKAGDEKRKKKAEGRGD